MVEWLNSSSSSSSDSSSSSASTIQLFNCSTELSNFQTFLPNLQTSKLLNLSLQPPNFQTSKLLFQLFNYSTEALTQVAGATRNKRSVFDMAYNARLLLASLVAMMSLLHLPELRHNRKPTLETHLLLSL